MSKVSSSKQVAFESYERKSAIVRSSERFFGLVFASFFVVVAIVKHGYHFSEACSWFLASLMMLGIAFICPIILKPLNKLWMSFGLLLHRIINPLVIGVLFFCVLTPMALLIRAFKKDLLRLKLMPDEKTYWIVRDSSQANDLKNQF